ISSTSIGVFRVFVHPLFPPPASPIPPNVTLFMVPCPCAGTGIPPPASARNTASAMRCDVSTFPAATALGERAFTRHPAGAVTRTARDTPPLRGDALGGAVRGADALAGGHPDQRRPRPRHPPPPPPPRTPPPPRSPLPPAPPLPD